MTTAPRRRVLPLAAWVATLVAVIILLVIAGHGRLRTPPTHDLGRWVEAEGSVYAAMALARIVALVLAGWLLVTTAVALAGRLLGLHALDVIALPLVRRMVNGAVGVGIVVGAVTATGAAAYASKPQAAAPTMVRLPDQAAAGPTSTAPGLTMRRLPDDPSPTPAPAVAEPPAEHPAATGPARDLKGGDNFWGIATEQLTGAWHRAPSEAETVPYWQALIAANRDVLADPGNPNLLFPGQRITLPEPPPPPSLSG
ncbi:MAG: resuscitation-promoting factor RpfA [Actinomycetota bacterium]|jgi:nucleoid-associated protein YgaU|nr:resuscitation-promoting factor RpfA [Actinomycetota bacterium]